MSLIDKCLQMREDRVLRCGNNEPWGYSILCAARELLAVHLGEATPEVAKAAAAERFVNMHLRILAMQDNPPSSSAATGAQRQQQQQQQQQSQLDRVRQALLSQLPVLSGQQQQQQQQASVLPPPSSQGTGGQVAALPGQGAGPSGLEVIGSGFRSKVRYRAGVGGS
jgi:hypothetical protein